MSSVFTGYAQNKITSDAGFMGVVLISYGIFMLFLSYRHTKITLLVTNWVIYLSLLYFFCLRIRPPQAFDQVRKNLYLTIAILGGYVSAMTVYIFKLKHIGYHISILNQGAFAGCCFAFFLWSLSDGGLSADPSMNASFVIAFATLGAFIHLISPFTFSPMAHPVIGAYLFIFGVDLFARTGWALHAATITDAYPDAYYHSSRSSGIETVFIILLAIAGTSFQTWQVRVTAYRMYHNLL